MPLHEEVKFPPRWPINVIKCFLRAEYVEEVEGDMFEEYQLHVEHYSRAKANYLYAREVFKLMRPSLIKRPFQTQKLNTMGMISNYSKVAIRDMMKHKVNAFIKIGGFAIGIAISLLIALFVIGELKTDKHLSDAPIYKVIYKSERPERPYQSSSVPPILAPSLKKDYPEIEDSGRILVFDGFGDAGGNLFRPADNETSIFEEKFGYADQSIIDFLAFDFVHGDKTTALVEPFSIIISESKAIKYFPDEDPVGKTIFINEDVENPYMIQGVFRDLENSHLNSVDFFFTLTGKEFWRNEQTNWCCYNYVTYIKLADDTNVNAFRKKLKSIHDNYFVAYERENDPNYADIIEQHNTLLMQHVSDIYLYSKDIHDFIPLGDIQIVSIFGAIAIFILLLACMNFINLATANSAQRAKEIGLRKAIGSGRNAIVHQFLIEAMILSFFSVVLGILLALLASPLFNQVIGEVIELPLGDPSFYLVMLLFTLTIGFISGVYPAIYLSGIETIAVLGGKTQQSGKGATSTIRSVLVVFQFAISMFLIAGALIVYKQMDFILAKDLGYDKEQILMVKGLSPMEDGMLTFKESLQQFPEVVSASFSNYLPVEGTSRDGNMFWKGGRRDLDDGIGGQFWGADDDYFETLGIEIIKGRAFSNDRTGDSISVVINESMAKDLGLDHPIDAEIENWRKWKIVGVMKDFNYDHLSEQVRPLMIARRTYADLLTVKLQTEDMIFAVNKIEREWERMNPNQTIRMSFLDQEFEAMYSEVIRTRTIFMSFAVFAIIVACLGLTGLTIYSISTRTKEITIRKVLGASIQSILGLLTIDYLKLIGISILIATPIGWYLANRWLEDFSYSIPFFWDAFLIGGTALLLIAIGVVSLQSVKAAKRNPALGLRDE